MTIKTLGSGSGVRVNETRPEDSGVFCDVLALATPGEPVSRAVAMAPRLKLGPPLTHGLTMCLTARTSDGQTVGALIASTPRWIFEHPALSGTVIPELVYDRVISIHGVAVHPGHRRQGVARKLIRSAERRARDAGYRVVILEHPKSLTGFYSRLGYDAGNAEHVLSLPQLRMVAQSATPLLCAAVPLTKEIHLTGVPGFPSRIICGLLPGTRLPATARYHQGQLTI
ncbi:GNAT family N-acetyltransferase [Streptomyces niveus]|uniref:GNAT family N-acetyltransferase n=1 Tax=Streptomyces niveus TaxID=193462 RepID=UPI003660809F